jgi:hypothetical protein
MGTAVEVEKKPNFIQFYKFDERIRRGDSGMTH